jgi:isopenicillin N synthase-like dioxygenase
MSTAVRTIRLDESNREELINSVRSACKDVGFFYLEGHGLEADYLEQVFKQSKCLFDCPLSQKEALADKVMSRGYTAMEEETLDPSVQRKGDTKEGYYIGPEISKEDPRYDPSKLTGPNQWPAKSMLPQFQPVMENYFQKVSAIGFRVVQLIALSLGLDEHHFDPHFTEPMAALRLLHYANEESKPEEGIFACGAHSDYGMITLLLTDEHAGLQILHENQWIDVPPKPHAFVVNLGDMLERWTNGSYKSTKHRVLTNGDAERYSIPFFYEPSFDTVVECLEVCCSETNPPKFPPTTSGQHLLNMYSQTHADFRPDS